MVSAVVILTACGGGGSGVGQTTPTESYVKGVAQLGYISGGKVSLCAVDDLQKPIAETTTVESHDIDKAGRFTFKNLALENDAYYLLKVSGGVDIDADDNGIADTNATPLKGIVHAVVSGEELKHSVKINALTDMVYEKIAGSLQTLSNTEIKDALDENTKKYLFDVNGDDSVDYSDILAFDPLNDRDKTKKSYQDILGIYIPQLHSDANKSKKLAALMFVDTPEIVVENGRLQEVPFVLNATLANQPKGLEVKWFVNNESLASNMKQIEKDGIYSVTAKLYRDTTLVKTLYTDVIATSKEKLASVQASAEKESEIVLTEETNSSLAGTQIIIPQGALKEDTEIVAKKASVNAVPSDDGAVGISDVLVMEPSGLTFEKPVQVRLPYDENLELNESNVRIARYSEGGKIDYIAPLYIDKEKHEVVFETEHFTSFKGETGIVFDTADEKFIEKLNKEFPEYRMTIEEWKPVLNVKLGKDFTVYDHLVEYFKNKEIVSIIDTDKNWDGYSEAYSKLYGDAHVMSKTYERWNSIKSGLEYVDKLMGLTGTVEKIKFVKDASVSALTDGIRNIAGLPQQFESSADPSSDYNSYIFSTADMIIGKFEDIELGLQIEHYFNLRDKGLKSYDIIRDLESTKGKKDDYVDIVGDERAINGWFFIASFSAKISEEEPPKNMWEKIDTMYDIYRNFKAPKYDDDFNEITTKDITKYILNMAKAEVKADGKYIKANTCTVKQETKNPIIGENIILDISCSVNTNLGDNFVSEIEIYKSRWDRFTETEDLFFVDYETTKISNFHYKIKFLADRVGTSEYKIFYSAKNQKYGLYTKTHRYYDINVRSNKMHSEIKSIDIDGILEQNGTSYKVTFTPEFDSKAHPPVKIVATFNGKSYEDALSIPKASFSDNGLESVVVTATMSDDYKDTYQMVPYTETVNIKALLDKALKERENNTTTDKTIEAPKLNILSSTHIKEGESISYSIDGSNIKSIIRTYFHGDTTLKKENGKYLYTVTYYDSGKYAPKVLVRLTNDKLAFVKADRDIYVTKKESSTEQQNSIPQANSLQERTLINSAVDIKLDAFDADGDTINYVIVSNPSHGTLSGTVPSLTYTPANNFSGTDTFSYKAVDSQGAASNVATVTIKVIKPIERYVTYTGESNPKDSCQSYDQTGCEAIVQPGQHFTKTWSLKNTGNVKLTGLKMVAVSLPSELDIQENSAFPLTLDVGQEGNFKIDITIPDGIKPGIYKALYKLVDSYGDMRYEPNHNTAYIWFAYKVVYDVPQITLEPVEDGVENSVFTFKTKLSEALESAYSVKLSLGDGGGGWLSPEEMIASGDRKVFALAKTITKPGDRTYRVAIFRGMTQVSDWVEGSYKVYSKSKIPQHIRFKWTQEGVEISWDPVQGASNYSLYTTMDWTKDGELMEIQGSPTGDEWLSDTSYLFKKSYFKDHKVWYFAVSADNGPVSERYRFEWVDQVVDNDYTKYLAGNSLYFLSAQNVVTEMQFNDDLTTLSYESNGTLKRQATKLDRNGLKLGDTNVYFIIKSVHQDYLEMEMDELSDSGVIIDRKKSFELYFDEKKVPQFDGDLAQMIVGKTFYQHCKNDNGDVGIDKITLQSNGKIKIEEHGGDTFYIEYSINDNVVLTKEDGNDEVHTFVKETNEYIQFNEDNGEVTIFYKTYQLAENAPVDDCGGDDGEDHDVNVSNLVSGNVDFSDYGYVPSDAWVRIVPSVNQQNGNYEGPRCKIDSHGNFGTECYIDGNKEELKEKFNKSGETFQVVVYKNHVEPEGHHWNCGEDVYKYVGGEEDYGSWSSIEVKKEDYQDRSNEECSDDENGGNDLDVNPSSNPVAISYNGVVLNTKNILQKDIVIVERDEGFAHIPKVYVKLDNGDSLVFKYCALNGDIDHTVCTEYDWLIELKDDNGKTICEGSGGFTTSDDPYNGRINGTFSGCGINGRFEVENMNVRIEK